MTDRTNDSQCPQCGSTEIGKGEFKGYAVLRPENPFSLGSPVEVTLCTECGHILSMRVTKPHKFK